MALSQVGVALECTEVALFEVGVAPLIHPVTKSARLAPSPDPVAGDAPHSDLIQFEM